MAGLHERVSFLFDITRSHGIARRYFVVNGFDGALTMLGLMIGFLVSAQTDLALILNACLGAAIALGMSGISSAYISEAAESKRRLEQLEQAMISDLEESAHGAAARHIPWLIALVNGAAPFLISLLIICPLWLSLLDVTLPLSPLYLAVLVSLLLIFLLGAFLGRIAGISWIRSGLQTIFVAAITALLIYLLAG